MVRAVVSWQDRVPERDGVAPSVYDVCFKPDGSQLVAAVGTRVLVYDAASGELLHSLKGHKDTLYCVAYARDGKRFASGGADKTIIIWTSKAEGILKFSHNDTIQCLSYNPATQQLASATAGDFGLWSPEQKSVAKHKVQSRILCMSWSGDGTTLALGHYSGLISLRDKQGAEKLTIRRDAPVWSLQWNPSRDEAGDALAVACWDQTLSFYDASGAQIVGPKEKSGDKKLGFDPCCVRHFSNGEYICVGGSDKKASLFTKDGVRLTAIAERDDWIWCCAPRPNANYVAIGTNDGAICMYQLMFSTVHGLYRERYAYRDYMTDVVVQHMVTEQTARIRCKGYVKKIAIYKERLAVAIGGPDRLHLYELKEGANDESEEMVYKNKEKLPLDMSGVNLLVLTALHFVLCYDKKLRLHASGGQREREWQFDAAVRYAKVLGGAAGREGLVIGLEDGQVLKLFIDNPFPVTLIKHASPVRSLDVSAGRTKLAVVDDRSVCAVYDLASKELLYEEEDASAVAWNAEVEEMVCFSSAKDGGTLAIKTANFPLHTQKLAGFVVGFRGSKIYCLHYTAMQTVDVPQSNTMYRYIDSRDFSAAYAVACLGVTDGDWRALGEAALKAISLEIARKCFVRLKESRYIELVNKIEPDTACVGSALAYLGKYQEAAKMFVKSGKVERALEMWSDLRKWEEAKQYSHTAGAEFAAEMVRKQAQWAEEVGDQGAASETYLAAGDYLKAIAILGEQGAVDRLAEVAKTLGSHQTAELRECVKHLERGKAHVAAKAVLHKLGDAEGLLSLALKTEMWDDALELVEKHPSFAARVHLPYAQWLAERDRFEEAQEAFKKAGQEGQSVAMLRTLTHNAVVQRRYHDAAHHLWLLASEQLGAFGDEMPPRAAQKEFERCRRTSDQYTDDPFTALTPDTVFNISRFLLNDLFKEQAPFGISKVYAMFALAKQAKTLNANKLARFALEKLAQYKVPVAWQEQVDLFALSVRGRPLVDAEELLPSCFRCQTINPLLNQNGDKCIACGHPFIRSFVSFEALPVVRFVPERGISPEEALMLLRRDAPPKEPKRDKGPANPWASNDPDVNVLSLAGDVEHAQSGSHFDIDDPFTKAMLDFEPTGTFAPVAATREMLLSMEKADVFVVQWPASALGYDFYRNMMPEVPVVLCHSCNHFFHEEDWDMAVMQKGCCPFCKAPVDASYGNGCALTHPPKKTAAQLKKGQSWDAVRNIAATSVQERVVEGFQQFGALN